MIEVLIVQVNIIDLLLIYKHISDNSDKLIRFYNSIKIKYIYSNLSTNPLYLHIHLHSSTSLC